MSRMDKLRAKLRASREAASRSIRLLDCSFMLPPGPNLVVAQTGKGKTSFFANLVLTTLKHTKGTVVCVLNEETEDDFYSRVAGLTMGIGLNDIKFGSLSPQDAETLDKRISFLVNRVEVIDTDEWNLNCVEDVLTIIQENATNPAVSAIFIDYLQNITESNNPALQSEPVFQISKMFGTRLKELGKTATCPIVVSAQIYPGATDVLTRVQNDRTFANHCKTVIEIQTDFAAQTTDMYIPKDRFNSMTGRAFRFKFELGKLNYVREVQIGNPEDT